MRSALVLALLATAGTLPAASLAEAAPVIQPNPAPFDRPPDATDASGLTLEVRDLVFTVRSFGGAETDRTSGRRRDVTLSADVLFAFNKATLTGGARDIVRDVAGQIKGHASGPVQVVGYTDSKGSDAINVPLSRRRAAAVAGALRPQVGGGVPLRASGRGSANPVAPNTKNGRDDAAGRRRNRRVEISFATAR